MKSRRPLQGDLEGNLSVKYLKPHSYSEGGSLFELVFSKLNTLKKKKAAVP